MAHSWGSTSAGGGCVGAQPRWFFRKPEVEAGARGPGGAEEENIRGEKSDLKR